MNEKMDKYVLFCIFGYSQKPFLNMLLYCRETGLELRNVSVGEENDNVKELVARLMYISLYHLIVLILIKHVV